MADEGYTLTEMLAAMMVLALSLGALWTGLGAFSMLQSRTGAALTTAQSSRQAQSALERLVGTMGSDGSDPAIFSGTQRELRFECGAAQQCGAFIENASGRDHLEIVDKGEHRRFSLSGRGPFDFAYISDRTNPTWPPKQGASARLRAIAVAPRNRRDGGSGILIKLWRDEPVDCEFDLIKQGCRR